jgi:diguanylate cyclase (GGDEF)-like protein/PAS domain S-box-containing protein
MTPARLVTAALAVTAVAYLLLPVAGHGRGTLISGASVIAAAVAVWGLARLPATARRPWAPLVAGVVVLVSADVVLTGWRLVGTEPPPFPGVTHLLYPLGALLVALGLATLVRRGRASDWAAGIDALTVTASLALVAWVLLVRPVRDELVTDTVGMVHSVAYPTAHLLLLVAVIRFALSSPRRHTAGRTVVAGALLLPLTATGIGILLVVDRYQPGTALDLLWLLGYALLAAGVCHPSAPALATRRLEPATPGPGRLALLSVVLLTLPSLQLAVARDSTDVVVALATATVLLLITARVGLLLREVRRASGRELEQEQERAQRRLQALVRHASDVLIVLDTEDRVGYATPSAIELFGTDPTGWTTERLLDQLHPAGRDDVHRRLLEGLATTDHRTIRLEARLRDRDDRERHVEVVAADLIADPDVEGTVLTVHDITERVELERRLRRLAFHDSLTGLCNRELFQDRLVQALRRATRDGRRVAVLICDLDDFKNVNDTHGHATGDGMLMVLAERLLSAARTTDTVARLGGDEFAIVCEGIDQTRDAIDVARRVLAATEHPVPVDGRELSVGVSVGIAVDDGSRSAQDLLRDADIALYEAKADGKQRWALHQESMTVRAQRRLQLATDLAAAVAAGHIEAAFQPIVSLHDGRIVGVEVLARWEHPDRGWVPPGDFIPLAEQSGLIVPLGDAVLDAALAALREWLDVRPDLVLRVGVNVSGRQMRDPGLPHRFARKLADHGIDPSFLVLELTESVMLDEADIALEVMNELRELGVRFAVDDFGTGYSSLAYLRRLPVSIVKTDRAFVHGLGSSTENSAEDLVRAIIEMARSLRLDVVAEGVETAEQHRALVSMGCAFGQGYHFARPVSAAALSPRLLADDARVVTREVSADALAVAVPTTEDDAADAATAAGHLRSG